MNKIHYKIKLKNMSNNYYSFLYFFDLIWVNPQLLIFNNRRYKTVLSSIASILIIIFSIIFAIISLKEYLKYENPIIVYSKDNDAKTNRILNIKDTVFIFQLVKTRNTEIINDSIAYFTADYSIMYENGTYFNTILDIEKCEFGKNLNLKYKSFYDNKFKYGREIKDFYCIGSKHENISLFYSPIIGYSYINLYAVYKNNTEYIPEKIQSLIVTECDLIDNSISQNFEYHFTTAYNSHEYTKINYNFQYIKYESDNGLFYKDSNILEGSSFSDITFFTTIDDNYILNKNNNSQMAILTFSINKSNYDNYKRSYPIFQSLLADVMSVVSLLFEIGRQISLILCDKKMSKDIIKNFFNKNNSNINYGNIININNKFNNNEKYSERTIIKMKKLNMKITKNIKKK